MAIRTAILGYGRSGSSLHAGPIERSDAFELAAVCDIDPARKTQASQRFHCAIHDDYRRMLDTEDLDLVVIVTRSDQHCQMTCDCLAAGVSVVVTKPWAVNTAEAERMVAAAGDSQGLLLPWLPARWGCDLRRLKQLMAEKAIGKVFQIRRPVGTFSTRNDWQTERRYGGGYLLNWGPHIVDPPVQLMGSRVTSVYARMRQVINPGDVEDVFFAVMNLADGTIVQVEHTIAVPPLPSWFIQGDRGTIVVNGNDIAIHKETPASPGDPTRLGGMGSAGAEIVKETVEGKIYGDEDEIYAEIASAIRGETVFAVTPADALELSRTIDAIRRSSEENRVVEL